MDNLIIDATPDTPYIFLDSKSGNLEFSGSSIPENTNLFYEPVLKWLDDYTKNPCRKTVFNFKMKMISSSSSKIFFDILNMIDTLFEIENHTVKVNWYYSIYDDEIHEIGLDYKDSVSAPFELILVD